MRSPPKPGRVPCTALTSKGQRCTCYGSREVPFCTNHDPARAAERRVFGGTRASKPIETMADVPASPHAERPRTVTGIIDSLLDTVALVKAGSMKTGVGDVVIRGLKAAAERFEKAEERKRPLRGVASVPSSPGSSASSSHAPPVAPGPSSLIGDMVAARKSETETVQ